jgi:hypothetical protein
MMQVLWGAAVLAVLVLSGTRAVRACMEYSSGPISCPYCRWDGYQWQWLDTDCGGILTPGLCTEDSIDYYVRTPMAQNGPTSLLDLALATVAPVVNAQGNNCWEWCDESYGQGCTLYA